MRDKEARERLDKLEWELTRVEEERKKLGVEIKFIKNCLDIKEKWEHCFPIPYRVGFESKLINSILDYLDIEYKHFPECTKMAKKGKNNAKIRK